MSVNERLRKLQDILGYKNQSEFAAALGIKQGTLSNIYTSRGGRGVSAAIQYALNAMGVNIDWLLTGDGEVLRKEKVGVNEHSADVSRLIEVVDRQAEQISELIKQLSVTGDRMDALCRTIDFQQREIDDLRVKKNTSLAGNGEVAAAG